MRFPDSFSEIHRPGGRYPPLKWPSKISNFHFFEKIIILYLVRFCSEKLFFVFEMCSPFLNSIWKCDFRALFVKSTDLEGGTSLWSDQTQNQWKSGYISSFSWTDFFVDWAHFLAAGLLLNHYLIWKLLFWGFWRFLVQFWNFDSQIFQNLKIWNSAWSLQRGVPPPRSVDFTKRARKSHFQIE